MPELLCAAGIVAKKTGNYLNSPVHIRALSVRIRAQPVRSPCAIRAVTNNRSTTCHCDEDTVSVRRPCAVRAPSVRIRAPSVHIVRPLSVQVF